MSVALDVSVQVENDAVQGFRQKILQILRDLNLANKVKVDLK